jgi:hemin uptake protein HemP
LKTLESGFNEDYFLSIDKRQVKSIQLFNKKAKIMTNHPKGTYNLVKDTDGNLILEINNPDSFWSLSKYLVIEIG